MYLRQLFCPNLAESAAVLLTVVCLLLLRVYRQKQKFNCLLRVRQAEIVRQNEDLARLNQQKDQLLSLISHDMRGPLNSIHGVLLLVQARPLPPDQVRVLLGKLAGEVQLTSLLLDKLLKWTASQMHRSRCNPPTWTCSGWPSKTWRCTHTGPNEKRWRCNALFPNCSWSPPTKR